jgi:hypothetical protein
MLTRLRSFQTPRPMRIGIYFAARCRPLTQLRGSRRFEAMIWMSAASISSGPPNTTWPKAMLPSVTS